MLSQFQAFIYQQPISLRLQSQVLLTVSGGLDSMVMLDLFVKLGIDVGIAHCNFQLRGAESDGDQQLVEDYAIKNNIPIYIERFETKKYAKANGVSTQMAARDLRYAWFEKIRAVHHYDCIATAHHQDDNLETILLNLTRGTGLAGLHGIAARNNYVIRPMLFTNREKIKDYALKNNIAWREDSSNDSTDYKRNKLRKIVLPILKEINPKVASAVYEMSQRVAASERMLSYQLSAKSEQLYPSKQTHHTSYIKTISIKQLEVQIEPVEFLHYVLKNHGFSYGQCVAIWQNRDCETGKQYLTETYILTKDRDCFVLSPRQSGDFEDIVIDSLERNVIMVHNLYNDSYLTFEYLNEVNDLITDRDTVFVNADVLVFPLTVRRWREGDWFCPLGMAGKRKKISDFLIDKKISRNSKLDVLVLESNQQIVWIIGLRLDERFKINEKTTKVIKVFCS